MRRRLSLLLAVCGVFFLWKGGSTAYFWIHPATAAPEAQYASAPHEGAVLGYLTIPRLHARVPIVEGISDESLQMGPGHLKGSSLPGDLGNSVLAAHRDTHFRVLKDIEFGEAITVERGRSKFVYTVTGIRIVDPSDLSVLRESRGPMITLITCYPFRFIGPAPQRFVVQATPVESKKA